VRAIERALEIVEAISVSRSPSSIADLARSVGLAPSTIHRILQTLVAHGYVVQYPATRRYGVGRAVAEIGRSMLLRHEVAEHAQPHLEALVSATGETAHLAVLYGTAAIYLSQVESPSIVRIFTPLGTPVPLHASAAGKVFLADFQPAMVGDVVGHAGLPPFTLATMTNPASLERDLARVRSRGYALDDEERDPGVRCLAAPVRATSGLVVAALGVTGPSSRITDDRLPDLAGLVINEANRLSIAIRAH